MAYRQNAPRRDPLKLRSDWITFFSNAKWDIETNIGHCACSPTSNILLQKDINDFKVLLKTDGDRDNVLNCHLPRYIIPFIVKGTNGRQKTYEIFHVYSIFYSGFMCQTTVIFGITKDGSLVLNTLASWNCFTCRNLFQNGANDMSECLTFETAFCKKAQNFV